MLGLLLLSGGWRTFAYWNVSKSAAGATINAGSVSITAPGSDSWQLYSQVVKADRLWTSTNTTCTPVVSSPYTDCRNVSSTLANEHLVVGDMLVLTRTFTVAGVGNHLKGVLTIDGDAVLGANGCTAVSIKCQATVTTAVTAPAGVTARADSTANVKKFDLDLTKATTGFGSYAVTWTMTIPPKNGGADWGTALTGEALALNGLSATFQQGKP